MTHSYRYHYLEGMEESHFMEKTIDHLVRTLPDGSEKIQCIELEGAKRSVIIICVYMPANGSKNHQVEYQECIDELHEKYLKYEHSHEIIIGGDINEDLNKYKPKGLFKKFHQRVWVAIRKCRKHIHQLQGM